jgi:hypothetical protein
MIPGFVGASRPLFASLELEKDLKTFINYY